MLRLMPLHQRIGAGGMRKKKEKNGWELRTDDEHGVAVLRTYYTTLLRITYYVSVASSLDTRAYP